MKRCYIFAVKLNHLKILKKQAEGFRHNLAHRIICEDCNCSEGNCLFKLEYANALEIVQGCIEEIEFLSRAQKKNYMLNKIKECITGQHESGNYKYNWRIGVAPSKTASGVCRGCFALCYGCGPTYIENIIICVKNNERVAVEVGFSDKSSAVSKQKNLTKWLKHMHVFAESIGISLCQSQIAAMQIPNSEASLSCFAWMHTFFDAIGDKEPDRFEIHLDAQPIKQLHDEYRVLMESKSHPYLGYSNFLKLWATCFPHVKVREYKAVSGKCDVCAALTNLRRQKLDFITQQYLVDLFALHRSMYMGERLEYYKRRNNALLMPSSYLSLIADGMQQSHCILPWQGHLNTFSNSLTQHLQGVLMHGRSIEIFRTFHNLVNNANLSIHCFLWALELTLNKEGKLPDTIYYQIDGGSENTSKHVLGICELLVAKRLCKKLILTRLPVGHTHEDIDSKFAVIWKRLRDKFILTPQHYGSTVKSALTTSKLSCNVHDIFAIPDYEKYISKHIDKQLARYAKKGHTGQDWTQLQWIFEAVPISEHFPCGARAKYRKYSSDEVVQILANPDSPGGFDVFDVEVSDYPAAYEDSPAGMHILNSLPNNDDDGFVPEAFVSGSRQTLLDVVSAVQKKWGRTMPAVLNDWINFRDELAPQSDDAADYCQSHGLYVPLKNILFGNAPVNFDESTAPRVGHIAGERKRKRAADSVRFRRVGQKVAETTPYVDINPNNEPNDITQVQQHESASEAVSNRNTRTRRQVRTEAVLCEPCSSSSESDCDDDIYNYIPLRPGDACSSNVTIYMGKVNNTFLDTDEDIRFRIVEVCEGRKRNTRGGNNAILFYKYVEVDDPDGEVHYTQCRELLNSSWAKWDPTIAASNRAARLSARDTRGKH